VTLVVGRETLPARVVEREADMLLVAVIVPSGIREDQLERLVLEYANPGGRVRLTGGNALESSPEGQLVRIERPHLLEVIQERAHVRVEAECPIVLKTARQTEPIHSHTIDISGGGVLLGTPEPVERGDRVEFKLLLEPGTPPIAGTAEVVRFDGRRRAGLEFIDIEPYARWRLIRFTIDCRGREPFRHPELGNPDA
jgi:hypothetical protein